MTDMTSFVKQPVLSNGPLAPVYTQCTAADKFSASGGKYRLHYKNAGTVTGTIFINANNSVPTPTGTQPGTPAGASRWNDYRVSASMGTSTELAIVLDVSGFIDATGAVNLQHVTPTTLTLAIEGPL